MTPCRLIVDPPQDGAWNMAVDEALLDDAADHGAATLRFYQWREPTISLGYFQSHHDRSLHPASEHAAAVRRLSGGGTLIHDRELTYSLCLPAAHPLASESTSLYAAVHRTLIKVLARWGLKASLYGELTSISKEGAEPLLCFSRRTHDDVVLAPTNGVGAPIKIVGSAQRRRRGAVLQHGAVLFGASQIAPELPGIQELTGVTISPDELIDPWQEALAEALALDLSPITLTAGLRKTAQRLHAEKYAVRLWTERR